MRLDHISYAAEPDGLENTGERIANLLGIPPKKGGIHPKTGTRNIIFPLKNNQYVEVIEALEHPATHNIPFSQFINKRCQSGGGWVCWVVAVEDIKQEEDRLKKEATSNDRHIENGEKISWLQLGLNNQIADPQLPFIFQWLCEPNLHPSIGWNGNVSVAEIEISGEPKRVRNWLNKPLKGALIDTPIHWIAPKGTPGIMSVTFITNKGLVSI